MPDQSSTYHHTIQEVYRAAAEKPAVNLCCVPQAPRFLPGLHIPDIMHEMNYGCGTTVHLQDMRREQRVLYVGVGGGLEALQLAYFCRRPGAVIAVDPVAEMRDAARRNLELAAKDNDWFDPAFVTILDGDALDLPIDDNTVDFAAQNCLFNIFKTDGDLQQALGEMHRVLTKGGRLAMSDPITPRAMPQRLIDDEHLRAACISGCQTYEDYLQSIVDIGFGAIEVRSRRPYRMLDKASYQLDDDLLLETVEVAAFKTPVPADGPCIFTGRCAIYTGPEEAFNDGKGHLLHQNLPMPVCDKTAEVLAALDNEHVHVTGSTWHYQGGGCC